MYALNQESVIDAPDAAIENGRYQMIDNIEIRNFRCFEHLKPTALKQFNVIVGESGSGKTSLMEAIFLHAGGSPEIYFRIRAWRGFSQQVSFAGTKESWELIFRDMFYAFDLSKIPVITSIDSVNGRREVEIYFAKQESYSLPLSGIYENPFEIKPVVFKWTVNNKIYESKLEKDNKEFKVSGSAPVSPVAYWNTVNTNMQAAAAAFSSISRRFQANILLTEIKKSFDFVQDINIEVVGGEAILHLSTGLSERLPIGDSSGGLTKFIVIALAILSNPGGVVLVDEIDSGFYYRSIPEIWASLVRLCDKSNTQLVATTHSYEFLKAIAPSLNDKEVARNFQMMRMTKVNGEQPAVKRVKADDYLAAIENDFEVR